MLIPNELPHLTDLNIESVYRPAREVGGDFFQIVPNEKDGTSLIAFGDVTGKGLQAGMLVAMIIGAIRSSAEHDNDPYRMLEVLNDFPRRYYEYVATLLNLLVELLHLVAVDLDGNSAPRLDNDGMDCHEGTVVGKQ